MSISYNLSRIIPAPQIAISKEYVSTDDGTQVGTNYSIQLKGTLLPWCGSPTSSGTFWPNSRSDYPPDETSLMDPEQRLRALLLKQTALRCLFATEGRVLEITPLDGRDVIRCNPRVKRIDFPEGPFFEQAAYSVVLEADLVYGSGTFHGDDGVAISGFPISKANEDWSCEPADERGRSYKVTHSVSATGKRFYSPSGTLDKAAWENARDYVLYRIGLGIDTAKMNAAGVLDGNFTAYNRLRTQFIGELGGTFSVTETFTAFNPSGGPAAIEDYTVNLRATENGLTTGAIEGSIVGLEDTSGRYLNAKAKWLSVFPNLMARAENFANQFPMASSGVTIFSAGGPSGVRFHPVPLASQIGINEPNGVINYNYEWNNRASTSISGAISETITIDDDALTNSFARITILGRSSGELLQDLGTYQAAHRSISIEAVMPASRQGYSASKPSTAALVTSLMPAGTFIFKDADKESWNATTGRYVRQIGFTYQ